MTDPIQSKEQTHQTLQYTVATPGGESQPYDNAKDAAQAFHVIEAAEQPYVIRVRTDEHGIPRAANIASTSIVGKGNDLSYGKWAGDLEPAFKDAYETLRVHEKLDEQQASNQVVAGDEVEQSEKDASLLPDKVRDNYLQIKGKFYFGNKADELAFIDKGNRLKTKLDSTRVAADMVDVANARGWQVLKVKGTDSFKREVWLEAGLKGIHVNGYKPRDEDRALLDKRLLAQGDNEVAKDRPRDKGQATPKDSLAQSAIQSATMIKLAEKVSQRIPNEQDRQRFVDAVSARVESELPNHPPIKVVGQQSLDLDHESDLVR